MPKVAPNAIASGESSPGHKQSPVSRARDALLFKKSGKTAANRVPKSKTEAYEMSFISLKFLDQELEVRFRASRKVKYRSRLRFGSAFTAFFIPMLVIMQVCFKENNSARWTSMPYVMLFPG